MKVLYLSQYFPPEMGAPAARVDELSREWARCGHEVSVLTGFAHHPVGRKAPGDRFRWTRRERRDGVDVVRAYVWATPNRGRLRRMLSYASFMVSALLIGALRVRRPDVVVATSPQLLCACAGWALARLYRVPFVFEVRDLWPESIVAVAAMRENLLVRALRRLAGFLYRKSDLIVTVGAGYARQIRERYGVGPEKIDEVPNGIDTSLFVPGPKRNEVRRRHGWGDRFVVLYIGTHGMAHALDVVLDAAEELAGEDDKLFVFVGEGAEKDRLRRLAGERRLPNVVFVEGQPKERVPLYYAACDVGLVSLRATPLFQDVLPSKIFEYLGMERPILLAVGGEARQLVEASGGGFYVPPEDPAALAAAVRRMASGGVDLEAMGRRGREFVVRHYDRRVLAARYLEILRGVAGGGGASA